MACYKVTFTFTFIAFVFIQFCFSLLIDRVVSC
jgi:hypothetical protein